MEVKLLKRTPFYNFHVKNNGKIVPFAGYEMPVQFKGVIEEIKKVRTTVGVFDVSHMGEIIVRGEKKKGVCGLYNYKLGYVFGGESGTIFKYAL